MFFISKLAQEKKSQKKVREVLPPSHYLIRSTHSSVPTIKRVGGVNTIFTLEALDG